MNASKTLASTFAALAVVGSIGIAYAQTTTEPMTTPPTTTVDPNTNAAVPATSTTPADTSTTMTPADSSSAPSSELAPQADRG